MPQPTALFAPAHVIQRRLPPGSAGQGAYDAPSMFYGSVGLQDPRLLYNYAASPTGAGVVGWCGGNLIKETSQVPSAVSVSNIAAAQHTTNGVPLTLVSATGAGITYLSAAVVAFPYLNTIAAGTLAIDLPPGLVRFGRKGFTAFYDPTTGISRGVSITAGAGASGGAFTVRGYDWYGQAMSQTITAVVSSTVNSTKTFKFITSVTPAFTDGTGNYSVGTADIYGFNLAADFFSDVDIYWNNAIQVASTFTAAATATATPTTGDTRGTFTPGSASNGSIRLDMFVAPSLTRLSAAPMATGLFGVTQA